MVTWIIQLLTFRTSKKKRKKLFFKQQLKKYVVVCGTTSRDQISHVSSDQILLGFPRSLNF